MSYRDLERMREVGAAQLEAVRRGDLDAVESLEKARKELIEQIFDERLFDLASREPESIGKMVREIMANDRLVRVALEAGMQERKRALDGLNTQSKAEKAYRGVASRTR